jgi:tRNA (guanine37-N1)-methyltransferase
MKPEPVIQALESIPYSPDGSRPYRVMLTPQGELLQQKHLNILSQQDNVVLVCGRYEGFDERVREYVDQEISLGDFVLGGGEVAAMVVIEGIGIVRINFYCFIIL